MFTSRARAELQRALVSFTRNTDRVPIVCMVWHQVRMSAVHRCVGLAAGLAAASGLEEQLHAAVATCATQPLHARKRRVLALA